MTKDGTGRRARAFGSVEPLESRHLLASDILINEIHYDPADRNVPSEFIEIHNAGDMVADLSGWRFTNGIDFTFAQGTQIAPNQYAVVAQDSSGFAVEFGRPRGENAIAYQIEEGTRGNESYEGSLGMDFVVKQPIVVTELGAFDDNSRGLRRPIKVEIWSRDENGTPDEFNDDTGTAIVAEQLFTSDDEGTLFGGSRFKALPSPVTLQPGAYSVVAFGYGSRERNFNGEGAPAGTTNSGDGLVSFVGSSRRGEPGRFPDTVDSGPSNQYGAGTFRFNSAEPLAPFGQPIGVWSGKLANDGEQVVLRDALGDVIDQVSYDVGFPWPTASQGEGASMELIHPGLDNDLGGSWRASADSATPGLENSAFSIFSGPQIRQVNHLPNEPASRTPVTITAKVTDPDNVSQVVLEYQPVDPGGYIRLTDAEYAVNWTSVAMRDDGQGGDQQADDDVYTVVLPETLQTHRRLIRYRIRAADNTGNEVAVPYEDDPQPNFAYFVYDGIPAWTGADRPGRTPPVTYDTTVMNSLPAYHLIANQSDVVDSQYNQRFRDVRFHGTLVFQGIVYDHIQFANRGQNSTYVTGKNKWKLHFNRGHEFQARDDYGRRWKTEVRSLNISNAASPWARPNRGLTGMDEALAFKFYNLAGVAAPNISAFQLRVIDNELEADPEDQYEGDLWGFYLAFEDPNGDFLEEHGLPDGNLFRMQAGATRQRHQGIGLPDDLSDIRAFTSTRTGYNKRRPVQPVEWWRENVDLEGYYSYRAVIEAINNTDLRDQENSLQYFNPQTGKWSQLPWDLDLLYEEFDRWGPDGVQTNTPYEQFRKSLEHEEIHIEFQARLREMQDLFFNSDQAWQAVEEYARYVEPMADVDRAMWNWNPRTTSIHKGYYYRSPAPYHGGADGLVRRELTSPDFEGMVNWVKEFIVPGGFGGDQTIVLHTDPDIPLTSTITYVGQAGFPINRLQFQTSAFADPQGDDTFGAMQWRIGEVTSPEAPRYDPHEPVRYEITSVWESGELPQFNETISVDASGLEIGRDYRARVRFKDQTGRWSHWSDAVQFIPTDPVGDQLHGLRIAELNYNPHDALTQFGEPNVDNDMFEFVELVNAGEEMINLAGVRFVQRGDGSRTEGLSFQFGDQQLGPDERIIVVRDVNAFQARYGNDLPVAKGFGGSEQNANQYAGALSNGGETITLLDARGGVIQSLAYDDSGSWPDRADGRGSSLELIDISADSNDPNNWRASETFGGSPGRKTDEPRHEIIINEVLARTDLPAVDQLELLNRSEMAIDLQHWYISDSAGDLFKFQFAQSTILAAGEYLVLSQNELGFGFSGSRGDDAWLIEADSSGRPLRVVDRADFSGSAPGVSLGRSSHASGPLLPMSKPTLGGLNAAPAYGDANADGRFNQLDLDEVVSRDKYLSGLPATFRDGDWNSDGVFDQLDIVLALQEILHSPE